MNKTEIENNANSENNVNNEPEAKSHGFKSKEAARNLKVRFISTIFLLILLFCYVATGAIYTECIVHKVNTPALEVAAYFCMFGSFATIGVSVYELNNSLGFNKTWMHILSICLSFVLYVFPTSYEMGTYHPYSYMDLQSWWSWWMPLIVSILIAAIYLLSAYVSKKVAIKDTLFLIVMVFVVVYGYKGFTNTELQLVNGKDSNDPYDSVRWQYGFTTVLWAWLIIIFNDTFAYFGGTLFGKHKFAPVISPKKTWEGTIIGVTFATVCGSLMAILLLLFPSPSQSLTHTPWSAPMSALMDKSGKLGVCFEYIAFSFVFSVTAVLGDLAFSVIKRYKGIKNYSNLIPGHGGYLDRMDSFTLVFFLMFFLELVIK